MPFGIWNLKFGISLKAPNDKLQAPKRDQKVLEFGICRAVPGLLEFETWNFLQSTRH
jgi:hypothetical protein